MILIRSLRGQVVQSCRRGAISIVDHSGKDLLEYGPVRDLVFTRSVLKPVQALPVLESGAIDALSLPEDSIALMCGSHSGEAQHRYLSQTILSSAGLTESDLLCGTHKPFTDEVGAQLIRSGQKFTPLYNNCSGKHAGFLAMAVRLQLDPKTYLDYDSKVQVRVREWAKRVFCVREQQMAFGVDGCTAPNYAMPLRNIALGYANLATFRKKQPLVQRVVSAMLARPFMVAGSSRFCTVLMQELKGKVLAKVGAGGLYCVSLLDRNIGLAVKVEDGIEPAYNLVLELLTHLGYFPQGLTPQLAKFARSEILNCRRQPVGKTVMAEQLKNQLVKFY